MASESDNKKNLVWDHFTRAGKDFAKCKLCKKTLKVAGGSTSGLHSHLKTQHNTNLLKRLQQEELVTVAPSTSILQKQKNSISSYFKKDVDDSLAAVISRMATKDGVPFMKFCSSDDLRKLFKKSGYEVPKSPQSIKKIVMEYGRKIRGDVKDEIGNILRHDGRFSLTFDEWTSVRNRRYINIIVHGSSKQWKGILAFFEFLHPCQLRSASKLSKRSWAILVFVLLI